ncbi:hypothetical protein [Oceanirhabdus sp. W0125-5]|uniref:hypothetical protein n=1 Tax=Oceanirhabdus sp. W0125-5 TaxID=2999116 RepID=UPI0022F2EB1B|nr:hypothetical protein [Oceanirhabdus sp. W0125-5]WBW96543.1 hypothetical protein OW730_23045 [Oceanirhabdus sp. W0125-5]
MVENRKVSSKSKRVSKVLTNILIFIIVLGFWSVVISYGYTYAKNYIDTSINNVRHENAMNIEELKDQVKLLSDSIKVLNDTIDNTDTTISSTTDVQKRIDDKLEKLDAKLKELEKSLSILKGAP